MSNHLQKIKTMDMTDSELDKINEFIERGLPGIGELTNTQLEKMYELYLGGNTYTQIAVMLRIKKVVVLYLAHHSNWYASKQEYLNELQEKIKNMVAESKLKSSEFMLLLVQSWQKKIGEKLVRYLSTGDDQSMDDIDLKELAQLMKAIEMVKDMDASGKIKGKTPAVGIDIGKGVTVEKTGDNKVTIRPNEENIGDILKRYADSERSTERLSVSANNDIIKDEGVKDESK